MKLPASYLTERVTEADVTTEHNFEAIKHATEEALLGLQRLTGAKANGGAGKHRYA